MKPTIIKADIAGRIVMFGENDIYYVGGSTEQGVVYKSQEAFDEHDGICYVPEAGFFDAVGIYENVSDEMIDFMNEDNCCYVTDGAGGYTRDDIYAAMYDHLDGNDEWVERMKKEYGNAFVEGYIDKCVEIVFQELDWQCPETLMDDWDWYDDWEQYLKDYFDDPRLTDKQKKELGYD